MWRNYHIAPHDLAHPEADAIGLEVAKCGEIATPSHTGTTLDDVELTRATNPYSAGAGTMPPFLAGRDRDVERFDTLLARLEAGEQGRSLVYSGLRGVGKTVLLLEFEKLAAGRGWDCTGGVEIGATTDLRGSIDRLKHC